MRPCSDQFIFGAFEEPKDVKLFGEGEHSTILGLLLPNTHLNLKPEISIRASE